MQIHELTQPRKPRLDEFDVVGPDGIFSKMLNPNAQNRYSSSAAKSMAALQKSGKLELPTLDSALTKLKANPAAKQWIDTIVAKWPEVAKNLGRSTQGTRYTANPNLQPKTAVAQASVATAAPVAVAPATANYGAGPSTATKLPVNFKVPVVSALKKKKENPVTVEDGEAQVFPNMAGQLSKMAGNPDLSDDIRKWIDSQLRTTNINTVERVPGVKPKLENLLNQVVRLQGNIPAQQKALHDALSLITAANHVLSAQERAGARGPMADRYRTTGSQTGETPAVELSPQTLYNLKQQARTTGSPRPAKTDNAFLNDLITKIWD
jgi:hypothetical protein